MEFHSSKPSNWKKILQIIPLWQLNDILIVTVSSIQIFVMDLNKNKLFIFLFSYSYSIRDTARKIKFTIKVSSVNSTKSVVSCGFGHIYFRNP